MRRTLAAFQYSRSYTEAFASSKMSDNEFVCSVEDDGIFLFNSTKNEWTEIEAYRPNTSDDIYDIGIKAIPTLTTLGHQSNINNNDIILCKTTIFYNGGFKLSMRSLKGQKIYMGRSKIIKTLFARISPNIALMINDNMYLIESRSTPICTTNNDISCFYDANKDEFIVLNNDDFENGNAKKRLNINTEWKMKGGIKAWRAHCIRDDIKPVTIPKGCGSCCTDDGKFVFVLGGSDWFRRIDGIYIYDTENKRKWKSIIKLPKTGYCEGIMLKDKIWGRLLIAGFVNKYSQRLNNIIPECIIDLIGAWFTFEYLHWIHKEGDHYKILIDRLFQ